MQHTVRRCGRKRSRDRRRVQSERQTGFGVAAGDIPFLPLVTLGQRTLQSCCPEAAKQWTSSRYVISTCEGRPQGGRLPELGARARSRSRRNERSRTQGTQGYGLLVVVVRRVGGARTAVKQLAWRGMIGVGKAAGAMFGAANAGV